MNSPQSLDVMFILPGGRLLRGNSTYLASVTPCLRSLFSSGFLESQYELARTHHFLTIGSPASKRTSREGLLRTKATKQTHNSPSHLATSSFRIDITEISPRVDLVPHAPHHLRAPPVNRPIRCNPRSHSAAVPPASSTLIRLPPHRLPRAHSA